MADPGFPIGGAPTHWGGANLRCVHFSAKTYVKTKEIDPVGGARTAVPPLDPPMIMLEFLQENFNKTDLMDSL